jgi:hypothetical protein
LINGVVMTADKKPQPKATVRLRNLDLNVVEQTVISNERGEFSFSVRPQSPYIIEVVGPGGRVVAVGDVVVVNAGEVARAVVMLPSRLPVTGIFGDATLAVISAASSIGLAVVDPTLPKVSPTR